MSQAPTPPPLVRDYYLLIPHATEARLLLLPSPAGWSLPHFRSENRHLFAGEHIRGEVRTALGLDTALLRCLHAYIDPAIQRWRWAILVLENRDPGWQPPAGARWADAAALADLPPAHPEHGPLLGAWLAEETSGQVSPLRPAWERPGWLAEATAWLAEVLARRGQPLAGPVQQVKMWAISCLLRGHTPVGDIYFKAAPTLPLFTNEPAVMAALAARYPALVPAPLAVDAARRWMLLADFGGTLLEAAPLESWDGVVCELAAVQRTAAGQVDDLLAAGCLDRRLDVLARSVGPFLEDAAKLGGLTDEELAGLHTLAPRLGDLCAELATYGVPQTLVHGDLHQTNIAIRDGAPLFFDWSDACITHPFFDLVTLLDADYSDLPTADRTRLHDLYLAEWAAYDTPARLAAAAALAQRLGPLHHAISYQHILRAVAPTDRWQYAGGWTQYARQLLTANET